MDIKMYLVTVVLPVGAESVADAARRAHEMLTDSDIGNAEHEYYVMRGDGRESAVITAREIEETDTRKGEGG